MDLTAQERTQVRQPGRFGGFIVKILVDDKASSPH